MSIFTSRNLNYILAASVGACSFWMTFASFNQPLRPGLPHPGLKDGALKQALQKDFTKSHDALPYIQSRKLLFTSIDGNGRQTNCRYTGEEIKYMLQPLPNKAAVEHAMPLTRLPAEARSDLHHMFVVTPEARVARLNLHYGAVLYPVWSEGGSKAGPTRRVVPAFEVRKDARGDIARAMFHISTMYQIPIPEQEEKTLRAWHKQDPVSKEEQARNNKIAAQQNSRNPYIDYPDLTQRISDF